MNKLGCLALVFAMSTTACGDDSSGSGGAGQGSGGGTTSSSSSTTTTSSGTTTTTTTTATTTSTGSGEGGDGTGGAAGTGGSGTGGATGTGGDELSAPVCDDLVFPPDPPASDGACLEIGGDFECNPVTNEGCDNEAGEVCDVGGGGFVCYPFTSEPICAFCNDQDLFCNAGMTCSAYFFPPDEVVSGCSRYCCTDADCGDGVCQALSPDDGTLGICLTLAL